MNSIFGSYSIRSQRRSCQCWTWYTPLSWQALPLNTLSLVSLLLQEVQLYRQVPPILEQLKSATLWKWKYFDASIYSIMIVNAIIYFHSIALTSISYWTLPNFLACLGYANLSTDPFIVFLLIRIFPGRVYSLLNKNVFHTSFLDSS